MQCRSGTSIWWRVCSDVLISHTINTGEGEQYRTTKTAQRVFGGLFILENDLLSLVSIWTFFAFRCSFWFFVPTKSHNEQCDAQMETSTKNQNEQQKAITSNKRHLPVLVFEIELILSQKQERATKSSKRQRTANGNTHQKPKRATKSNKEHFSFPFSFIRTSSGPVEGGLYQEQ